MKRDLALTVQSRLLQCKVIELLLNHTCTDKIELPMSRSLLLHFVQSTMLPSDPTDGEEKWKKWNELVQLLWMLLLSYEDVTVGHLRRPVTQRAGYSHPPIWTVNDDITRFAVQEAAESFLSRASADIGDVLPPQVLESFSYLKDHLLFVCQH
ncbi:hypothetical protein JZ751_007045 [Albula glossodonta]|uniref:Uncharacterized protein n=1 Tax=Albula glossodonta TaxID=121402 RepID=A0A8T2P631_9TELE|nr:hypothetical protein JZ751_007045 [Albula glossodonta]